MDESSVYRFSIQPFWRVAQVGDRVRDEHIAVSELVWSQDADTLYCVPGNGQIAIMLTPPEEFSGTCYGVVDCRHDIPLYGRKHTLFARFSPGKFSAVCGIPAADIPADGVDIELLFPTGKLEQLRKAALEPDAAQALLRLFERWGENCRSGGDQALAEQAVQLIRGSGGTMRMRQMEQETMYSARRIQDVLFRQVGLAPKQLCRQTRFQNALRLLGGAGHKAVNCAQTAQLLGYSDQAHFNREFKSFCGMCPSQFLRQI